MERSNSATATCSGAGQQVGEPPPYVRSSAHGRMVSFCAPKEVEGGGGAGEGAHRLLLFCQRHEWGGVCSVVVVLW